jgi:23S rRNA (cytidine1920-2'-O)/16S rRNA (cytidine1409-2'-O)-methyltransferase
MKKIPIGELLINNGYFTDKKLVESWIISGKVFLKQSKVFKADQMVDPNEEIIIKGIDQKYVSKGGLKLEGALNDFNMDIRGIVAIDAGASTGGFTDCLVQHGATKVYAVDVGYGQLSGKLRINPIVVCMEKVNISDIILRNLDPTPSLATIDLSYLSLKKAIPVFAEIMNFSGDLVCLVKPLFEVDDCDIRRVGEINDIKIYKDILLELIRYTNNMGFKVIGITHSHVTGNKGTREFFIRITLDKMFMYRDYDYHEQLRDVENAIQSVMDIIIYKK